MIHGIITSSFTLRMSTLVSKCAGNFVDLINFFVWIQRGRDEGWKGGRVAGGRVAGGRVGGRDSVHLVAEAAVLVSGCPCVVRRKVRVIITSLRYMVGVVL